MPMGVTWVRCNSYKCWCVIITLHISVVIRWACPTWTEWEAWTITKERQGQTIYQGTQGIILTYSNKWIECHQIPTLDPSKISSTNSSTPSRPILIQPPKTSKLYIHSKELLFMQPSPTRSILINSNKKDALLIVQKTSIRQRVQGEWRAIKRGITPWRKRNDFLVNLHLWSPSSCQLSDSSSIVSKQSNNDIPPTPHYSH